MNLQPHIIVLHWVRLELKKLASNPDYLNFSLGGYRYGTSIEDVYGAQYIDKAVQWIQNNEKNFNFSLGYRLDVAKLPSVSVMFSGGTEARQIVGDDAGYLLEDVFPEKYAEFHASDITSDGHLVVSADYRLEDKIWRGLVIQKNGVAGRKIIGLLKESSNRPLKIITDQPFSYADGLSSWSVYSCADQKRFLIGSSFDRISVKVYLDMPGDPELCEVMSSVMRAILKNARMYLIANGLNEVTLGYSPIGRNESYSGLNVWTAEFTISGQMTDRWLMSEQSLSDKMTYEVEYKRRF